MREDLGGVREGLSVAGENENRYVRRFDLLSSCTARTASPLRRSAARGAVHPHATRARRAPPLRRRAARGAVARGVAQVGAMAVLSVTRERRQAAAVAGRAAAVRCVDARACVCGRDCSSWGAPPCGGGGAHRRRKLARAHCPSHGLAVSQRDAASGARSRGKRAYGRRGSAPCGGRERSVRDKRLFEGAARSSAALRSAERCAELPCAVPGHSCALAHRGALC